MWKPELEGGLDQDKVRVWLSSRRGKIRDTYPMNQATVQGHTHISYDSKEEEEESLRASAAWARGIVS